ncbi:hypothetical protein RD792_004147 [Penstemon davidsonii]|uniref:Fungal lipase-type domain-containing protein n=1 Tax=Penstemon davidsonii TaxID=160366 RepID=A0ABR0DGL7_9LAMI|nr:hypothetical protein RD792_004147 [Penstemon davidsonii]
MLLNSNEASFLDLCKILFSSDIGKRKFVDCPEGVRPEPFGRRWIIFVSVLAQKMLQAVSKPLAGFGSAVEYWLNLLSFNQGLFRLIMNYIKGNVIYPDKTSASFLSFIGHIDSRLHLDSKISAGDKRYHALLSIMAAKASYENKNCIDLIVRDYWKTKFNFLTDYQEKATTQAFILEDKNDLIIVSFRGTETFDADAWSTDVDISWYELPQIGKVHGGFLKALGLQTSQGFPKEQDENKPQVAYYAIRKLLKEKLQSNDKAKFIVTGHSLGGALAALFPAILALHEEKLLLERLEGVYTFGQPRVGDEKFGEFMKGVIRDYDVKYCRCVYGYDLVPRLPYDDATLMFKHFGSCIYFDSHYQGKKMLQYHGKILSSVGSGSETSLNLLANRSNLEMFLKNIVRGKVVMPDENSSSYVSFIGHLDKRVELDKNIIPGSEKYFASLSAMASKLAYENKEFIKVTVEEKWKYYAEKLQANTTQAFVLHDKNTDPDTIIVSFRGTEVFNAKDWITDLDISWYKPQGIKGRVHSGFMKALGLKLDGTWPTNTNDVGHQYAYNTITQVLKAHLNSNSRTKFIVTGHSLGGALAVLFPAVLAIHKETEILERLQAVYTFGQPRVGDMKFGNFMKEQFRDCGAKYYRFVYGNDIVPRVPFDDSALMFKHFGTCVYVDTLYEAKILEEEPMKNYFDLQSFFTKRADALWELVRSFVLPRMFGEEYKEGLLLKTVRMVGLLCPGVPDHGPQDYINATKLANY